MNARRFTYLLTLIIGCLILILFGLRGGILVPGRSTGFLIPDQQSLTWDVRRIPTGTSPLSAKVRYVLVNQGHAPVRILSVESGCGCAKPLVQPAVVDAGQTATVDVDALIPELIDREVKIQVKTDSKSHPIVELMLHIKGLRQFPALVQLTGDVTFDYGAPLSDCREVVLVSAEPLGIVTSPSLKVDLPFMGIRPKRVEEHLLDTRIMLRKRVYEVYLDHDPPTGTSLGSILALDPWNHGAELALNVMVRKRSALSAVPQEIRIGHGANEQTSVIIHTLSPTDSLNIRLVDGQDLGIRIEQSSLGSSRKVFKVQLILDSMPRDSHHDARLEVSAEGISTPLLVPIRIGPISGDVSTHIDRTYQL